MENRMEERMEDRIQFESREEFHLWLAANEMRTTGIWLIFGKGGKLKTPTAKEALDEALCFGWIDGLMRRIDDSSYMKYFAPRRKGSAWSEKNRKAVTRLITEGRMTEAGLSVITRAKADGTWDTIQDRSIPAEDISAFEAAISGNEVAAANFNKMPMSVKTQFVGLYKDAKKEDTRIRRLEKLIGLLEQNKRPM